MPALLRLRRQTWKQISLLSCYFHQKILYHASGASAGEDQLWWEHHVWPAPWISNEFSQYQLLNSNDKLDISWRSFATSEIAVAQDAAWIWHGKSWSLFVEAESSIGHHKTHESQSGKLQNCRYLCFGQWLRRCRKSKSWPCKLRIVQLQVEGYLKMLPFGSWKLRKVGKNEERTDWDICLLIWYNNFSACSVLPGTGSSWTQIAAFGSVPDDAQDPADFVQAARIEYNPCRVHIILSASGRAVHLCRWKKNKGHGALWGSP